MTAGPVFALQANTNDAVDARNALAALFGAPYASVTSGIQLRTAAGAHGVIGAGDLAVSQHGTPNMSVDVAAGRCVIRGSEATVQGVYPGHNTASLNVVISAADATNARKDLIVAKIRDSEYSGANDDFTIVVVTGTPAGSPADPSVPENCLVLARVAVAANASSIVTANITDLRTFASAVGGILPCTSTTRPSGAALRQSQAIYETDTKNMLVYDGTNWNAPANFGGTLGYTSFTSDKTGSPGVSSTVTLAAVTITAGASRRIRVTGFAYNAYGSASSGVWAYQLRESSTVLAQTRLLQQAANDPMVNGGGGPVAILTPSAGSHTYTFYIMNVVASGSVHVEAGATYPGFILVEDIGGA